MPIERLPGGTVFTGPAIDLYRLVTLKHGLALECKGLRMTRGRSCYSIVKQELGFKGNKARVLAQLTAYIDKVGPALAHAPADGAVQ